MRDLLALIRSRRSVRKYVGQLPSARIIHKILEAGRWAPSGLNNQPWRFCVVKTSETKERLGLLTKYRFLIKAAPVLIALFIDLKKSYHREKDLMAMGACAQNMLLEAHALGLGGCWIGEILNNKEAVRQTLGLNKKFELTAVIAIGCPRGKRHQGKRRSLKSLLLNR